MNMITTSALTADKTVGELVTERPARSRVFEKHGIDYCCGGKRSLSEACARKGLAVDTVLLDLAEADAAANAGPDNIDYGAMPLDALADHIVETHHAYLRVELPRLQTMSERVAKIHGGADARLVELGEVVNGLALELDEHMMKEERILFPFIRQLVRSKTRPFMPFGTLANPIRAMEAEHDSAAYALDRAHTLTDDLTPPDWVCNTYRALFDALRELEADLHLHIHKENNILFPRALERESALPG